MRRALARQPRTGISCGSRQYALFTRLRSLIAMGKGSCEVIVQLTTGSELESLPGKGFQQSVLVTVN